MIKNTRKGFTTVELVIVIAVIAILATALIPTFGGLIENANTSANERKVENAYKAFLSKNPAENAGKTVYIKMGDNSYYKINAGTLEKAELTLDTVPCTAAFIDANATEATGIKGGLHNWGTTDCSETGEDHATGAHKHCTECNIAQ